MVKPEIRLVFEIYERTNKNRLAHIFLKDGSIVDGYGDFATEIEDDEGNQTDVGLCIAMPNGKRIEVAAKDLDHYEMIE